jgi:glycosyltransferase involved in cell wall biosynthesis
MDSARDEISRARANITIKRISVVIPTFNEEASVTPLYQELSRTLETRNIDFEILFVDDGSEDGTTTKLRKICESDTRVKLIRLRSNYGQSTAMEVGFQYSRGEAIITLDADGQNDPADIPKMVNLIEKGYDVVSGWRRNRKDSLAKLLPSRISNWLVRALFQINIHDSGCTLKAYTRNVVVNLNLFGEIHRYIPVLLYSHGFSITELVVNHRARKSGKSKYGTGRLIRGAIDLLKLFLVTQCIPSRLAQFLSFVFRTQTQFKNHIVLNKEPSIDKVLFVQGQGLSS